MARKKKATPSPEPVGVTPERAERLCQLVQILAGGDQTRTQILRRLKLDVRKFYRDLELLRRVGVGVELRDGRYRLTESKVSAVQRLPFPDPSLTIGEAQQLSKGRTAAHRRLKERLEGLLKG